MMPADFTENYINLLDRAEGRPLDGAALRWFLGQGIDPVSIASPWAVTACSVYFNANGIYEPAPASGLGDFAFVIGINDEGLVDLAAWCPKSRRIASRLGIGWAIGQGQVERCSLGSTGPALPIFRSPVGWLRADRRGLVVVDWRAAAAVLAGLTIEPEDADHARELGARLQLPRPRFLQTQRRAAA